MPYFVLRYRWSSTYVAAAPRREEHSLARATTRRTVAGALADVDGASRGGVPIAPRSSDSWRMTRTCVMVIAHREIRAWTVVVNDLAARSLRS
jgi:hypothetical protein